MPEHIPEDLLFVQYASPIMWADYGAELAEAVYALFREAAGGFIVVADSTQSGVLTKPTHSRSALLLAGLALENILKGHMVADDPSLVSSGKLAKRLRTHDLTLLASRVPECVLTPAERRFAELATEAFPGWGRYPIPLEASQITPEQAFDEISARVFWALYWRLDASLRLKLAQGWDSGVGVTSTQLEYSRPAHPWDAPET